MQKTILLTIDVEDWFQVENLRPWFPPSIWHRQELRVGQNTRRLLDLFDSFGQDDAVAGKGPIKATFFVLGWVAERLPDLIREIQQRGHEVASHGYGHLMCDRLGKSALKEDLMRSKHLLESIVGSDVKGYRAPNFSVNNQALVTIQAAGYRYDSSFNNFSKNGRYGRITVDGGQKKGIAFHIAENFFELPISNLNIGNQILPWGGGGYFRLLPLTIFMAGVRRILNRNQVYLFYLHPWEVDPDQPKAEQSKGALRWRHYLNLDKTQARLSQLISSSNGCRFLTCRQYLEEQTGI